MNSNLRWCRKSELFFIFQISLTTLSWPTRMYFGLFLFQMLLDLYRYEIAKNIIPIAIWDKNNFSPIQNHLLISVSVGIPTVFFFFKMYCSYTEGIVYDKMTKTCRILVIKCLLLLLRCIDAIWKTAERRWPHLLYWKA